MSYVVCGHTRRCIDLQRILVAIAIAAMVVEVVVAVVDADGGERRQGAFAGSSVHMAAYRAAEGATPCQKRRRGWEGGERSERGEKGGDMRGGRGVGEWASPTKARTGVHLPVVCPYPLPPPIPLPRCPPPPSSEE